MTSEAGVVIGVDIGGTKVLAGVVSPDGEVVRTSRRTTPGRRVDVAHVEAALDQAVREVAGDEPILGVGIAAAGFVDAAGEVVRFAPHLPWQGHPVRQRFEDLWGAPVALDNDATCATLAEWTFGAARGADSAVLITLGTGIGGGLVVGGRIHRGANGMAGEFGHMQVVPDGEACECGGRGCWEQYCSGNALVRAARRLMADAPSTLHDACAGRPEALTGPMISTAAIEGDLVAHAAFTEVGAWLGVGAANLVAAFDPEIVVVGGGVSAAGDLLLKPACESLPRSLVGAAHRQVPPLVGALLGPAAGLVGGAELVRRRLEDTAGG